jgi:hypothetical protein
MIREEDMEFQIRIAYLEALDVIGSQAIKPGDVEVTS